MREVLDQGFFKTKLKPLQLAKLVSDFYAGRNDTEIARDLGDEKLSKTVARARIRLKLFRDMDFRMPFEKQVLKDMIAADVNMKEIAEQLDVSPSRPARTAANASASAPKRRTSTRCAPSNTPSTTRSAGTPLSWTPANRSSCAVCFRWRRRPRTR
jgi:hypothetical protein